MAHLLPIYLCLEAESDPRPGQSCVGIHHEHGAIWKTCDSTEFGQNHLPIGCNETLMEHAVYGNVCLFLADALYYD